MGGLMPTGGSVMRQSQQLMTEHFTHCSCMEHAVHTLPHTCPHTLPHLPTHQLEVQVAQHLLQCLVAAHSSCAVLAAGGKAVHEGLDVQGHAAGLLQDVAHVQGRAVLAADDLERE